MKKFKPNKIKKTIIYQNNTKLDKTEEINEVPIYRKCENEQCYCTGICKEIVGYRKKDILEK